MCILMMSALSAGTVTALIDEHQNPSGGWFDLSDLGVKGGVV